MEKLGISFQGDWLAAFLSWVTLAGLIASLFTRSVRMLALSTIGIAAVGTAITIFPGFGQYWWVVLIASAVLLAFRRERTLRKDNERLAGQNQNLRRILRNLGQMHKRAYKTVKDAINREIEEDGTDDRTREISIVATTDTVSWIDIGYGTTASDPYAQKVTYDSPQITDERGNTLKYEIYEDEGTNKRALIFLPRPLKVGDPHQTIKVRQRIRHAWGELIENLQDFSEYEAKNDVDELVITVRVPPSLRVQSLEIDPHVGTWAIAQDQMSVSWSATGLKRGANHRYTLRCLAAKN